MGHGVEMGDDTSIMVRNLYEIKTTFEISVVNGAYWEGEEEKGNGLLDSQTRSRH